MTWVNLTDRCIEALILAQREASFLGDPQVDTEHILVGLVIGGRTVGAQILESHGVDQAAIRALVDVTRRLAPPSHPQQKFGVGAQRVLQLAMTAARELQAPFVTTDHLFIGLLRQPECAARRILEMAGVRCDEFLDKLLHETAPRVEAEEGGALVTVAGDMVLAVLESVNQALDRTWLALQKRAREVEIEAVRRPISVSDEELNEETFPIGSLVQRILSRAIITDARQILLEPSESHLTIRFIFTGGDSERVDVPKAFKDVLSFNLMRQARINPMEKGREHRGQLVFAHRGHSHFLDVHSEPIHKGVKLRLQFRDHAA